MKRVGIALWTVIASVYLAAAFIFHSPGQYPNNFLGDPTIGLVGLLAVGLGAGALARLTGTDASTGWAIAMAGSAIAFFLAANLWVLEPTVFHVTRPGFIEAVGLRLAAGCTAISVGYWASRLARRRSGAVKLAATAPINRRSLLAGIGLSLVVSFGLSVLLGGAQHYLLDPSLATVRVTASEGGLRLEPATIPAGGVNVLLTVVGAPKCQDPAYAASLGLPADLPVITVTQEPAAGRATPAASPGPPILNPSPPSPAEPAGMAFAVSLPAHQAGSGAPWELDPAFDYPVDSVGSLAPGTAIWSCGSVQAVMTVH